MNKSLRTSAVCGFAVWQVLVLALAGGCSGPTTPAPRQDPPLEEWIAASDHVIQSLKGDFNRIIVKTNSGYKPNIVWGGSITNRASRVDTNILETVQARILTKLAMDLRELAHFYQSRDEWEKNRSKEQPPGDDPDILDQNGPQGSLNRITPKYSYVLTCTFNQAKSGAESLYYMSFSLARLGDGGAGSGECVFNCDYEFIFRDWHVEKRKRR